ncbi:hypothetical protein RYX36_015779 [Vicia faba]
MTTFSTEFLSHTLNFRNHPNRTSRRSNPNTIVTSSTPDNTNNRRTRIRVNETRPKLDQDYDEALIRSFKSAKYNQALRFLKRMVDRGYKPDAILCTKLINGFFNSKKTQKAIRVMEILEKHGQADVFAYEALLNGYCKADIVYAANKNLLKEGKWEAGESLMSDMLDKGCEPSCVTYSILICSLCRDGKIVEVENVLKGMKKRGLAPNAYCYNPLISAICKEGKVNLAIEYLNNMISDGGLPSIVSYNSILASLCKNGHADEALNIFEKLGEVGCPPDAISYDTLFGALWSSGDEIRALGMILDMLSKGIDPDKVTYSSLISYLCRDGFMDQAIELLVDMMESHKYQPAVINYNAVIYGLCKVQRIIDAIESRVTKLIKMQQHGGMKEPG